VSRVPRYCPGSRDALMVVANKYTLQARDCYAKGRMAEGAMCAWMSMYFHFRAQGHSKRNSEMRVMAMERRDEL
jgi:hypothetical protein